MSTIPAAMIVDVLPSVLSAGGNSLILNGLVLTKSTRVPIGTVLSFPTSTAVGQFFGLTSPEALGSPVYFNSYNNSTQKPGACLFAQYNPEAVPAYLQSGNVAALGTAAIAAMSGTLTVVMDGYTWYDGSLSLAGATSPSAAAALIQAGLAANPVNAAVITTSTVTAEAASVVGTINGYILTVTTVNSGTLVPGTVLSAANIIPGTIIESQISNANLPNGGLGTYALNSSAPQIIASTTITGAYGQLDAVGVTSGTLSIGQTLSGPTTTQTTATIVAGTAATFTGSVSGYTLTAGTVTHTIYPGAILSGTGVTTGTQILSQLTGSAGAAGTYLVSISQNVYSTSLTSTHYIAGGTGGAGASIGSVITGTASGTVTGTVIGATVTAILTAGTSLVVSLPSPGIIGTFTTGTIDFNIIAPNAQITGLNSGTGLTGTYYVNGYATGAQTVASATIDLIPTPFTVTFDSVSGSFLFTSGVLGTSSTATYATGTLASSLLLTSATGAILSQGSYFTSPSAFMNTLTLNNQNWASFLLDFDADFGSGNTQKLAFCNWVNSTNDRYAFMCWDNDITPTESTSATNSLGYLIGPLGNNYSGTCLIYDPSNTYLAWFAAGYGASLDFGATNGRTTAAFRTQSGIPATVTNQTIAENLIANGYNFYGVWATANQDFVFFYPGSISGPFQWLDSYMNQIWLNSELQLAEMELLTNIPSIPYTPAGYALIEAAALDPINAGLNFGAFRAGVTLSQAQIAEVNNAAGANIAPVLSSQGWYFQVQNATAQVREARASPPVFFWYTDGQSVQSLVINSILVQ